MPQSVSDVVYGYESPQELDQDLWEIRGLWKNKMGRRMTVVRLNDSKIMIHNPIRLHEKEMSWLKNLGKVAFIIAPNNFHCSDLAWMGNQFPEAQCYVPEEKRTYFQEQKINVKITEKEFPRLEDLECIYMAGTKVAESAFIHHPSKTLILCDLAFNMPEIYTGIGKYFMRWNKAHRLGPTKITRLLFTKDKNQLIASYEKLLSMNFDRVIVNHGEIVHQNGKALLARGVQEIFA